MSDVAQAQDYIRQAFPSGAYGNAKAAIWAAKRKLKLGTERRARALWNGEAKRIDAHEMEALKHAALEQARREFIAARNRLEAMQARMGERHAYRHRPLADLNE